MSVEAVSVNVDQDGEELDFTPDHDSASYYRICLRALGHARRLNDANALHQLAVVISDIEKRHPEFVVSDDGRTTERDW